MTSEDNDVKKPMAFDITALDTYSLIGLFINVLSIQAWQHMGLRIKPGKDKIEKDLEQARIAIDCIAFLTNKLEPQIPDSEKRQLRNQLTDLQMNFVRLESNT